MDFDEITVLTPLEGFKKRPKMYLGPNPTVQSLYDFLCGWDLAKGTNLGITYIRKLSKLKNTGCKVPDENDISFDEAFKEFCQII